jgi:N-acyl-D-amino-acid deacylase
MEYDLIIRNGTVIDGSGAARFAADVPIAAGKIAALIAPGDATSATAPHEIDARGLIVAPGFIDLHSHSDWVAPIPEHPVLVKPFLLQGVTTFVGGNCGFSTAPVRRECYRLLDESARLLSERELDWGWQRVSELADHLKRQGMAINMAHLAGHGSIRLCVMGRDTGAPSDEQLSAMRAMVEQAMGDGAVGFSTGLGYFPGMVAKPAELTALAEVAGAAGGLLTSHLRVYGARSLFYDSPTPHNLLAVREMVDVARAARVSLQISHLIFVGRHSWDTATEVLADIERARNDGVDVAFDTFPYTGGNTTILIFFPAWAQDHPLRLLHSDEGWTRLNDEMRPLNSFFHDGAQLLWGVKPELREFEGKFFGEIAEALKLTPAEAYLTIARASEGRARVMFHRYSGDDHDEHALRAAMAHPLNAFEMDTFVTSHGHHNPASFGTYPKILGYYVRELKLLTLEQAVHKSTGMAAERMRLRGRGLIHAGAAADITIFNAETVGSRADFRSPALEPIGIEHVLVNGRAMVADGKWCGDGVAAGQWISRG